MLTRTHFPRFVEKVRHLPPQPAAFVFPCDRDSVQLALAAAFTETFAPLLVGPEGRIRDVAGAQLLVHEAKLSRDTGSTLYLSNLKPAVRDVLQRGSFLDEFGRDRVFDTKDEAIRRIYAGLDSERCRTCTTRIFNECAVALPDGTPRAGNG